MIENLWHLSHFLVKLIASVFIVGQKYLLEYMVPLFKVDTLQDGVENPLL